MLYIHGVGHFHPENIIDNAFLENLDIGTSNQWIMERVGINKRHTVLPLDYISTTRNEDPRAAVDAITFTNAKTAAKAAQAALAMADLKPSDIGLVLCGGCAPDTVTPAESCVAAAEIGIDAPCFDLNSACSSFGAHIHFLLSMKENALPDYVLILSPENNTKTINYSDRNTAVLWGDGTSAAILSTKIPSTARIQMSTIESSPSGWDKVVIPRLGHFSQQGKTVQSFAIKRTVRCFKHIKQHFAESGCRVFYIGHQANMRMLESAIMRTEIEPEHHLFNVSEFGNTGAAGAPIVLSQNWNKFKNGDVVGIAVVGAGLTWSSLAIEFGGKE